MQFVMFNATLQREGFDIIILSDAIALHDYFISVKEALVK